MKYLFVIFMLVLPLNISAKQMIKDWPVTNIHKILTSKAPWLNLSKPLTDEDLKGRIILLDFWTFCCINCIHVIPDLHYLEKKFGDRLLVIGVHSAKFQNEKDQDNIRSAILRYDIEHPVINDGDFKIWNSFGVRAWPSMILISPEGRIHKAYSGEGNRERLDEDISALIKKYKEINISKLPLELEKSKSPKTILSFPGKLEYGDNKLFISDSGNNRILITNLDGKIEEIIGSGKPGLNNGSYKDAEFFRPQGIAYHDNTIYVADTSNHAIRRIDLKDKKVATIAGTGKQGYEKRASNAKALSTPLASPWDITFYPDQQTLVIAMAGTHQLWAYDIKRKTLSVIAGNGREYIDDGVYPENSLSQPSGLSSYQNKLYFVDSETSSLRVLDNGSIKTLIGTGLFDFGFKDGDYGKALMQHALGLTATEEGVFISDSYNHSIRKYDYKTRELTTIFGDGKRGQLNEPNDIIFIKNKFYITDTNNHKIQIFDHKTKSLQELKIVMPSALRALQDEELLPNLERIKADLSEQAKIKIILKPNWKINDDAPSYIALFEEDKLITSIEQEALLKSNNHQLPKLKSNKNYRLQGTLYYCEDKENSICLVKSIDAIIKTSKTAKTDSININL